MKGARPGTLKRSLFFLFNSVFAFCAALYLHEIGHAVFIKWIHGYYPKIAMNPLAGGYVSYYSVPQSVAQRLWISSGGILLGTFGGAFCAGLGLAVWRSVWAAPLILLGIVSVSVNSLMLTAGYFLFSSGDIHRMIDMGFPLGLAVVLGVSGLVLSGYLMLLALPYFGLGQNSTLREKYIVLCSGVVLYGGLVLIVTLLQDSAQELYKKWKYVITTLSVLGGGLFLIDRLSRCLPGPRLTEQPITHAQLIMSLLLATGSFVLIGL